MGFCSILTLILVVAKIIGLVTFSWWIVFAPVIISVVIKLILFAISIWAFR